MYQINMLYNRNTISHIKYDSIKKEKNCTLIFFLSLRQKLFEKESSKKKKRKKKKESSTPKTGPKITICSQSPPH